jgi:flagellar biosynthesis protein FlhG
MPNRTIAIASGKGGVGKTFFTANLSLAIADHLSAIGQVVSVDLDLGCGNLNTCLGVRTPSASINDFIMGRTDTLVSTMSRTDANNLRLISGAYDSLIDAQLSTGWKQRLLEHINGLDAQFTCLDLSAGASNNVIDFFLAAKDRILVITPESLSLHNAFLFIKSAIIHLIDQELSTALYLAPIRQEVHEILHHEKGVDLKTLVLRLKEWDRVSGYLVRGIIDEFELKLVVNMYRGGEEKKYLERFHNLLLRRLYLRNFQYVGVIHYGRKVHDTAQQLRPYIRSYPKDSVSRDIHEVADRLVQRIEDPEPVLRFPRD